MLVRNLGRMPYAEALALQHATRDAVRTGAAPDTLLLVEHEPVVTLGRRGDRGGILAPRALARAGIDVVHTERGGDVTYHGPGQLVAYPILDLRRFDTDLRWYVQRLEGTVIRLLAECGIDAWRDPDQHGVFTACGKIASVGVHVSRWVTIHGLALNVDPDMAQWALIAPCGRSDAPAASMAQHLPVAPPMADVRDRLVRAFAREFALPLPLPVSPR